VTLFSIETNAGWIFPASVDRVYCDISKLRCIFSTIWSMLKLDGR
jgi:hypothetical protein